MDLLSKIDSILEKCDIEKENSYENENKTKKKKKKKVQETPESSVSEVFEVPIIKEELEQCDPEHSYYEIEYLNITESESKKKRKKDRNLTDEDRWDKYNKKKLKEELEQWDPEHSYHESESLNITESESKKKRKKDRNLTDEDHQDKYKKKKSKRKKVEETTESISVSNVLKLPVIDKKRKKSKSEKNNEVKEDSDAEASSNQDFEELLEKAIDKYTLPDDLVMRLKRLYVLLPWGVPPLHKIGAFRGLMSPAEHQMVRDQGIEIKLGMFTKQEDETIKKNWKEFCKSHDFQDFINDPRPFLSFKHINHGLILKYEERLKFVQYLAHGLPNRTLYSVFSRFKRLFRNFRNTYFSENEDQIILDFMENYKVENPFKQLSMILNRSNLAVKLRYDYLISSENYKKDRIDLKNDSKIQEIIDHLVKITKVENVEALKNKEIKAKHWKKLSKKMNMPSIKLQRAWNRSIYLRLFAANINTLETKRTLFELIDKTGVDDFRALDWKEIAKNFNQFTPQSLQRIFDGILHFHCPKYLKKQGLREVIKHLKQRVASGEIHNHIIRGVSGINYE